MSNINLLQRLMKENRPPFLPFSQSCFNYFKVRGFIGFSELCIRTFHPDSQRYICPYLPDAHILEFRLPAATIECVINKQGICIEAIMSVSYTHLSVLRWSAPFANLLILFFWMNLSAIWMRRMDGLCPGYWWRKRIDRGQVSL